MKIITVGQTLDEEKPPEVINKFMVVTTLIALLLAFTSSMTITQMSQNCIIRRK